MPAAKKQTTSTATRKRCASASRCSGSGSRTTRTSRGGGLVNELGKLAIPLALIAAKEGVQSLSKKGSRASGSKKKSTGRRAAVGGGDGVVSPAPPTPSAPTLMGGSCRRRAARGGGDGAPMPTPTQATNSGGFEPMAGGAASARQHAAVRREFARMAREIGSFLRRG